MTTRARTVYGHRVGGRHGSRATAVQHIQPLQVFLLQTVLGSALWAYVVLVSTDQMHSCPAGPQCLIK